MEVHTSKHTHDCYAPQATVTQADLEAWLTGSEPPPASSTGASSPDQQVVIKLFSLNDYVGLSNHPRVRKAAADAAMQVRRLPAQTADCSMTWLDQLACRQIRQDTTNTTSSGQYHFVASMHHQPVSVSHHPAPLQQHLLMCTSSTSTSTTCASQC